MSAVPCPSQDVAGAYTKLCDCLGYLDEDAIDFSLDCRIAITDPGGDTDGVSLRGKNFF